METEPIPCQARGARTSQEMSPCASLSVSQEQAGHRHEPRPLPGSPEPPARAAPSLGTRPGPKRALGCGPPGCWARGPPPKASLKVPTSPHPGMHTPGSGVLQPEGRGSGLGEAVLPAPSSCPLKKSLQPQGRGMVHLSPQFHLSEQVGWAGAWLPGSVEEWGPGPPCAFFVQARGRGETQPSSRARPLEAVG